MGGGRLRAGTAPVRPSAPSPPLLQRASHHSCALPVIPAQAGTTRLNTHPFPNSSLPPSRGEVRWGVGGCERAQRQSVHQHPLRHYSSAHPIIPAPFPSFLRRQEPRASTPTPSPIHPSPLSEGRLGGGWEVAGGHRASPSISTPSATTPARIPSLPRPYSVIPAQAGTCVAGDGAEAAWAGRRDVAARSGAGGRLDSCLRRNDGRSAGITEWAQV